MARPTVGLIEALRRTVWRLEGNAHFYWSHQGACICGNVAQVVTQLSAADIHRQALEKAGDWGEHAYDYCATSRYPIDHILEALFDLGLNRDDIYHLERLSDPKVLATLPASRRDLERTKRQDAIDYLRALADQLESQLPASEKAPAQRAA